MSRGDVRRPKSRKGFNLVESIIVVVVLTIAAAGIISLQSNIFVGRSENKDIQIGAQLLQECAEQVLAIRRRVGYTAVTTSACSALPNPTSPFPFGGFNAPSITLNDNGSVASCPSVSSTCKVDIRLTKQGGGPTSTPITLQLTNY